MVVVGNHGNKKEQDEQDKEASEHPTGEEVYSIISYVTDKSDGKC